MSTAPITDLRHAFDPHCLFAPDESSDLSPDDDTEAGPSPTDDESGGSHDTVGEGDEGGGSGTDIKDPEKKALHDEAAKWRKQFRAAESRIQELEDANNAEALAAENVELRLRMAFERAASDFVDLDAAWKLAQDQLATVEIKDGTPDATRVGEIVRQVADRYPYLVDGPAAPQVPTAADLGRGASAMNGRKTKRPEVSEKVLAKKYPALGRFRR